MSDADEEYENFCYYGTPLVPYDEDSIPKRRPISVEEQIATDAQGRRRFHGAFTGGFSAGFFNTVGSLEGWLPRDFKSSRSEKAKNHVQKPEDYMDEEDLGIYGIAPQVIKATNEYNTSKKRKKQVFSDGPIPGEPVLHQILTSGNETVGYLLLRNLGIKEKIRRQQEELETVTKIYGCQIPKSFEVIEDICHNQYEIPQIYKDHLRKPKDNTFGLGYKGLNKNSSSFSLFPEPGSSKFTVIDKTNKKMSIAGQAFGVGAFEEEDDDIYIKDDMSKYDFELGEEKKQIESIKRTNLVLDLFIHSKMLLLNKKVYPAPKIPHSFTGKHKIRKSRFEPIKEEQEQGKTKKINPAIRAKYLGEDTDKEYTESRSVLNIKIQNTGNRNASSKQNDSSANTKVSDEIPLYLEDKFVSSSKKEDMANILEPVEKMGTTHGTDQMREAARMKMFGALTRITSDWIPCSLLCKRFNVPEPFVDRHQKQRSHTKNLIFEYQKYAEEQALLKPGLSQQKEETPAEEEAENIEVIHEETTVKPKTEENEDSLDEPSKDTTEKLNLDQKQDLFKAIFLSSDESEDEGHDQNKEEAHSVNTRNEELKSSVLSDELLPKIKPVKEGILSGVNFHQFTKPTVVPKVEENTETTSFNTHKEINKSTQLYGPKIPEKISTNMNQNKTLQISTDSEEEWIEKNKTKKKKHKREKKHKKDKHKKHKHDKNKNRH